MNSDERKIALKKQLTETREKLLNIVGEISGEGWQLKVQTSGDEWTALQMMRHLQDAHIGLTRQAERLITIGETVPLDFDVDRWNARVQRKTSESNMTPEECLERLADSHETLMQLIDGIKESDWEKIGWQAYLQRMLPLEEFIQVIATHESGHTDEIIIAVRNP